MRLHSQPDVREPDVRLLRLDRAHSVLGGVSGGATVRPGRSRQACADPTRSRHVRQSIDENQGTKLRVCAEDDSEAATPRQADGQMLRRFRNNFHTLSHIARDPLLWYAEEGAVLTDLRETLYLTESALRHFETARRDNAHELVPGAAVLAIANVVEERVDRLFQRMERLTSLRQSLFRTSAILEGVPCGIVPRAHDLDEVTTAILDNALEEEQCVTLLDPDSSVRAIRIAAHVVNVAQIAARLAIGAPAWREECGLAVSAALLQDLGMMLVPPEVFDSAAQLTAPQQALVQQHPVDSASMVRQIRGHDERLVDAVRQHHERLDGSGYPERLSGEAVGSVARLLAVADTYVAIQSRRSYRPAMSAEQACVEIDREAVAGRLDPAWTRRLAQIDPHWLKIPVDPEPPSSAPAVSALAA